MQYTPEERRKKLNEILEADPDYRTLLEDFEKAKARFEKYTGSQPRNIGKFLWSFPGNAYFLHQRAMELILREMRFPEEE